MEYSFVALDFETANHSPNSACEIGLVRVEDGKITKKFYSLIRPPDGVFERQNTLIHGLTSESVKSSPLFKDLWPDIKVFIGNNPIVAHNISTDLNILKNSANYYSIKIPNYECFCTYEIFDASLDDVCYAYGIERLYHNALLDAEACALIFINCINGIKPDWTKTNTLKRTNLFDFSNHDRIKGECLKPDFENGDPDCCFFKKKVVITGVFTKVTRSEISRLLKEKGADVDTSVTDRTNYLITGIEPGPVKIRKYEALKMKGTDIKLMLEDDFLEELKINFK